MQWLTRCLCWSVFLRMSCLVLLFIISVGIEVVQSHSVHAAGGGANFSLQPAVFDPKDPVTQSYFIFNRSSSRLISSSVRVINTGHARGSVAIYVVDATTGPTGSIAYQEHTAPRYDIGVWTVLSLSHLVLGPGQSQNVPFRLNIPLHASIGQHIGGIVAENITAQSTNSKKLAVTMNMKKLYVVPIVVNIPGNLKEQLLASGVQFDSTSPFQRVLVGFSNTGNVMIRPRGTATITDSRGSIVLGTQINLPSFLPYTTIQYPLNIMRQALSVGAYKIKIVLHYGQYTNGELNAVFSFQVKKVGKSLVTLASHVLTQGPSNIFSLFSLWQYVLGSAILLLAGSALFSWAQKVHVLVVHAQRRGAK